MEPLRVGPVHDESQRRAFFKGEAREGAPECDGNRPSRDKLRWISIAAWPREQHSKPASGGASTLSLVLARSLFVRALAALVIQIDLAGLSSARARRSADRRLCAAHGCCFAPLAQGR